MTSTSPPIVGVLVRLRDCFPADADLLDAWNATRDGGFNDFGPRDLTNRDALAAGPLRNDRNGTLIVETLGGRAGRNGQLAPGQLRTAAKLELLEHRHRPGPRRTRSRLRHRGATPPGRLPVRHDRCEQGRGLDRRREPARAEVTHQGRLPERRRRSWCSVSRWRLSRPGGLRAAARRSLSLRRLDLRLLNARQHQESVEIDDRLR